MKWLLTNALSCFCRRLESEMSDIKQEKVYMETKMANLEKHAEENQKSVDVNMAKVAALQDKQRKVSDVSTIS
jgi:hypothetical protein